MLCVRPYIAEQMAGEHRARLVQLVERELVGPCEPEERLTDNPQRRYICGQLSASEDGGLLGLDDELEFDATALATVDESEVLAESEPEETGEASDGEEPSDETASISKARRESLSSIGISCVVPLGTTVAYEVSWGEYVRADGVFARQPHCALGTIHFGGPRPLEEQTHGRVTVKWIAREIKGRLIASVFALNTSPAGSKDGTERLYQVRLALRSDDSPTGFLSRTDLDLSRAGRDLDTNDLLYRKRKEFGTGLHTAVRSIVADDGKCRELRSESVPVTDIRTTTTREFGSGKKALSMSWLAGTEDATEVADELRTLFSGYGAWKDDLQRELGQIEAPLRPFAEAQLQAIVERQERLNEGITLLQRDRSAFMAFRFANEVMARAQFRSSSETRNAYEFGTPIDNTARSGSWFPFQLAFLLSTIPDFVDPTRFERRLVDVLFFPTGGGKTEAYLGLLGFVMAFRRSSAGSDEGGAGVCAFMRYTLRLLTTQQFTRAATVICAAELVRRERSFSVGSVPFSIGLWVGPMTPQTYDTAKEALSAGQSEHFTCSRDCDINRAIRHNRDHAQQKKIRKRGEVANVLPVTECPWCFTKLCIADVGLDQEAERLVIRCPNPACSFSRGDETATSVPAIVGLPLFVVDSDVYRICPTLVVATVDKFATLPFRGEAKALFGEVSRACALCGYLTDSTAHKRTHKQYVRAAEPLVPVELIIQDELHTITDNLGSIYGLYETAIEYLTSRRGVAPKYVCATATVKAVERQIRALYGQRSTAVFPPAGLDAGDTFFSFDKPSSLEQPGRSYVGIYAPTFSRLSTFVAVLSAIMACAWRLKDEAGLDAADPYLTLLGYFNTIRDLGGVKGLLGDDVPPVLREIAQQHGWDARVLTNWQEELTGRISSREVPERLQTLQTRFVPGGGCDFMAATNMISVGVDVPRLGAMIVDGQPKTTAEYIQATSRVGRRHPGVVFVVYNSMRPRDVSHYEHFFSYHDSFYRFVEAGSVTPFSDGAVDRYVKSAFTATFRLSSPSSGNEDAGLFASDGDGRRRAIYEAFLARAEAFGPREERATSAALDDLQLRWSREPANLKYVVYRNRFNRKGAPPPAHQRTVMKASDEAPPENVESIFDAPRSMRNVEAEVPLKFR